MKPAPSVRRPVPPPCCLEPDRDVISRTLPCSLDGCSCPTEGLACRECPRAGWYTGACALFRGNQLWRTVTVTQGVRCIENNSQQGEWAGVELHCHPRLLAGPF